MIFIFYLIFGAYLPHFRTEFFSCAKYIIYTNKGEQYMLTIRIPNIKRLPEVITELQQLNFNYDIDLNIVIDRWSDELELADDSESNVTRIHDLISRAGESRSQMEQLRAHLKGE
jgi:hypothetical protein